MTDQQNGRTVLPGNAAKAITPHLDRFRDQSLTFSNVHAPSPHCCPSRATFFTGEYPSRHGIWNNVHVGNALSRELHSGVRLWSEDLREAGYELFFHGKWHVSNIERPSDRGWNEGKVTAEPGGASKSDEPVTYEWKNYDGDTIACPPPPREPGQIQRPGYPDYRHYGTNENPFGDQDVVSDAIDALLQHTDAESPWVRFVGTLGPHDPYIPPKEFIDMYRDVDVQLPQSFNDRMEDKPGFYRRTRRVFDQLSDDEQREALRHYLAFCTYEDHLFGQVLEALEQAGQSEDTIVIYMSDHGDYMGAHGLWCKGLPCFREAYHVPAIVRWPEGLNRAGEIEDRPVSLADFAPTFREIAGCENNGTPSSPGLSLLPLMRCKSPDEWRRFLFTQSNGNELYGIQRAVFDDKWKLVYNGFDEDELYDLEKDPDETRNLAADPEFDSIKRELFAELWQFARANDDTCINPYIMVGFAPFGPGLNS